MWGKMKFILIPIHPSIVLLWTKSSSLDIGDQGIVGKKRKLGKRVPILVLEWKIR